MKKLIIAVLMVAIVALGAMAQTTLNVLYYVDATQAGYDVDVAIWDKFIADNPDIEIVKEELVNEPYHQKLQAYVAAGTMPDFFYA
jgi:raffinose/stachyose/melibiose transport system substrate-binding protein